MSNWSHNPRERDRAVVQVCIDATCYWCSKRTPREGDWHQAECGPVKCAAIGIWDMLARQEKLPGVENR